MADNPGISSMTSAIRDRMRVVNKYVTNPVMMTMAGREHWYAGVVRHTGRRSGKAYATPVVVEEVPDGVIIPLPYGTRVDWLRNVMHEGRATVQVHGRTFDTIEPAIITAEKAEPRLPPQHRRTFHRFKIDNYLELHTQSGRSS
ncbi:nitroreductase/quinone reductase family protein [Nocardia vaccinii]|uniref:nitroreductase/quinone reductase family protein n=1 Tax=Nocardia vaccinii TaxID=1822 RepID=UPI00082CF137|nr:nitroreductase/quinone reductase family protein [Nocardia vaccinii]